MKVYFLIFITLIFINCTINAYAQKEVLTLTTDNTTHSKQKLFLDFEDWKEFLATETVFALISLAGAIEPKLVGRSVMLAVPWIMIDSVGCGKWGKKIGIWDCGIKFFSYGLYIYSAYEGNKIKNFLHNMVFINLLGLLDYSIKQKYATQQTTLSIFPTTDGAGIQFAYKF